LTRCGVLALQGAFIEHVQLLSALGVDTVQVRRPDQLSGLDALIIPGGESTSVGKLAVAYGLVEPIRRMAQEGFPIWGTCAGMILLARDVGFGQPLLGVMDIVVRRNAFGRQVDSFEVGLDIPVLRTVSTGAECGRPFPGLFIRAPLVERLGPAAEALARLPDDVRIAGQAGAVVAARQGKLVATAFHPELTGDSRFHRYFLAVAGS
jgi:5'-phosphate synthase pdxT subunit